MKTTLSVFSIIACSLLLVGCGTQTQEFASKNAVNQAPAEQPVNVNTSNYKTYQAADVQSALAAGKKVALFFHSKTCGSCAKLNSDIEANVTKIPSDLIIFKTDWDTNQALAAQYSVAKYHTVAFLQSDGSTSNNVKGLFTLDEVVSAVNSAPAEQPVNVNTSNYKTYQAADVQSALAAGKKVALFFHSKTCGSCAKLNSDIEANVTKIPSDLIIFKTDWDTNQALAAQYSVAKYHTVAFLQSDGSTSNNVKGLFTLDEVVSAVNTPQA